MKKTLALLLCLAMLFTALSVNVFAETTPSVTVVTHQSSAANKIDFAVTLKDFTDLKGVDLTIKGDDGVKFTGVTSSDLKSKLELNENYVISQDEKTLHIVELATDIESAILVVNAEINNSVKHTITVEGQLAKSGKELFDPVKFNGGEIAPYVAPEEVAVPEIPEDATEITVTQELAGKNYFIPYGAVYNGDATDPDFALKEEDGSFKGVKENTVIKKYAIPVGGFGTYAVTDSVPGKTPAKQFGNYVKEYNRAYAYGSLLITGDWTEFKNWWLTNKAYSDKELIEKIYAACKIANPDGKYNYVQFTKGDATVRIFDVAQTKFIWRNDTQLEYGVEVKGLADGNEYATVAYYNDGTTQFAKEIKTDKYVAVN